MDIVIYGTVNSVIFALIAVGFTLVYGVSRIPNFAHGSIYVLVGFLTWSFVNDLKINYALAILVSLTIAAILGFIIYRLILIRLRGMATSEIIASFAVSLIILEGLRMQGIAGFKGFIGPFYILQPFIEGQTEHIRCVCGLSTAYNYRGRICSSNFFVVLYPPY